MGKLLMSDTDSLESRVRAKLDELWPMASAFRANESKLPVDVQEAIDRSINSKTKTYRYVLPSQLLPKLVEPSLDCRAVQVGASLPGAFDARSICQHVIVPFDRANDNVLGGSAEPYANNPLRIPAIVPEHRSAQKDKAGFDSLLLVLNHVQSSPGATLDSVKCVLSHINLRLAQVVVTYPIPNRASLHQTADLMTQFLSQKTGGARLQSVAVALFKTIGCRFRIFKDVRSNNINAADASTGSAADLECVDETDRVVLAVEVKDRQLELRHVQDKLPGVRQQGVRELLFLIQGGVAPADTEAVQLLAAREFVTGQNLYVVEWTEFLNACLTLFGEEGRRDLLQAVGKELDERKLDIAHRKGWAELLRQV